MGKYIKELWTLQISYGNTLYEGMKLIEIISKLLNKKSISMAISTRISILSLLLSMAAQRGARWKPSATRSGTVIIILFHFGPYRVALVPRSRLRRVEMEGA